MNRPTRALSLLALAGSLALALAPAASAQRSITPPAPPSPPGTVKTGPVPPDPQVWLEASAHAVTVRWLDNSNNEDRFIVFRRDLAGAWHEIARQATRNKAGLVDIYSYEDTTQGLSSQCYRVAADGETGTGYSEEKCTVRPDPAVLPAQTPNELREWRSFTADNGGTFDLFNLAQQASPVYGEREHGIQLVWSLAGSLWKITAQGGPRILEGQAVALRVWGGGWLKFGHQAEGVSLQLSNTPAYEWHFLGAHLGDDLTHWATGYALWNSAAHDYLVYREQDYGINLDWRNHTSPPPTPPMQPGIKTFVAYNCSSDQRPLEMWVTDLTAGTGWTDRGELDPQWSGGTCPATGQPWTLTATTGHVYIVHAVDYLRYDCENDPTRGDCWRQETIFRGDANGVVSTSVIT